MQGQRVHHESWQPQQYEYSVVFDMSRGMCRQVDMQTRSLTYMLVPVRCFYTHSVGVTDRCEGEAYLTAGGEAGCLMLLELLARLYCS